MVNTSKEIIKPSSAPANPKETSLEIPFLQPEPLAGKRQHRQQTQPRLRLNPRPRPGPTRNNAGHKPSHHSSSNSPARCRRPWHPRPSNGTATHTGSPTGSISGGRSPAGPAAAAPGNSSSGFHRDAFSISSFKFSPKPIMKTGIPDSLTLSPGIQPIPAWLAVSLPSVKTTMAFLGDACFLMPSRAKRMAS